MAVVAAAHAGVFLGLGPVEPPPPKVPPPAPILVELVAPPVPPPLPEAKPEPQPQPKPVSGGGAPAAPSRVHLTPAPQPPQPELIAPVVKAPEPALVVGVAPVVTQAPGPGLGGEGRGDGGGVGDGSGPGDGLGPRLLRGPTSAEIRSLQPQAARNARREGRVAIRCTIRLDTRLDRCSVVNEQPSGFGFGDAALLASGYFRFAPPMTNGRPVEGQTVVVVVTFGR